METTKKLNLWAWILWGISSLGILGISAYICIYYWSMENFLIYILPTVLGMSIFSMVFVWLDRISKNKGDTIE